MRLPAQRMPEPFAPAFTSVAALRSQLVGKSGPRGKRIKKAVGHGVLIFSSFKKNKLTDRDECRPSSRPQRAVCTSAADTSQRLTSPRSIYVNSRLLLVSTASCGRRSRARYSAETSRSARPTPGSRNCIDRRSCCRGKRTAPPQNQRAMMRALRQEHLAGLKFG